SDDDEIVHDEWRRGLLVLRFLERRIAQSDAEIDDAVIAEVLARLPGRRIEREEPRVDRRGDDAATARLPCGARRVEPGGHAAAGEITEADRPIDVRVVHPPLLPRLRIERDDAAHR